MYDAGTELMNNMALRLLGYWIITYGVIRVFFRDDYMLVGLSYYLESIILITLIDDSRV